MLRNVLHIGPLRTSHTPAGKWRVTARVGKKDVYFEADFALEPAPEAFATAFFFPAMSRGLDLEIEGPVCTTWHSNMERVRDIARQWWSFHGGAIYSNGERSGLLSSGQGLFYGGGVDSMFAMHQERDKLTHLIFVEGYDVPLTDRARLKKISRVNRRLAHECGFRLVTLQTNLREHPDFKALSWTNSFGGALAGVGHLLQQHCGTFLIASDGHLQEITPWALGIHPTLVPEWASGSVRFILQGDGVSRDAKVNAIGRWPIARETLRVCWEYRNQNLNCGVCEKCLRTRLEFLAAGITEPLPVFPDEPIATSIDRLEWILPNLYLYYEDVFNNIKDPEIRRAIQKLGERRSSSGQKSGFLSPLTRVRKRLKRFFTTSG